jgi:SPP1 gp7 family putative phage head morphogenesis protein
MRKEFRHNRLALFDELNVIGVKKHVDKLYKKIYKVVKSEFLAVANDIYAELADELIEMGFDGDLGSIDETWIDEFLSKYSPVTKYVFANEIDRKKSRLFEALVASLEDRLESYTTAENLLKRQVKQCGIELEDDIEEKIYREFGVKKVKWVAEHDHKTCGVCAELDGEVFDLEDAPDKQHINCRCYLIPVKE